MTLRKKSLLFIALLIIIIQLTFGFYLIEEVQETYFNRFYQTKKNLSEIASSNILIGMELDQKQFILQFDSTLVDDKDFLFSFVYGPDDSIYIKFVRPDTKYSISEQLNTVMNDARFYTQKFELISDMELIGNLGTLVIGFDLAHIKQETNTILLQFGAFFLLITLILIFSLRFFMEKIIIKPINILKDATNLISKGDLRTRIQRQSDDELGELSAHFNNMAKSLSNYLAEKDQSKKEIFQLQRFLDNIIQNSPNGIIAVNEEGIIIQINQTARNIFNLHTDIESQNISIFSVHPVFQNFQPETHEVIHTKTNRVHEKLELSTQHQTLTINLVFYPLTLPELSGFVALILDVSQQVVLEKQLAKAARMDAIGTLAGGIAHDFNNILAIIQGNISILQYKITDQLVLDKTNIINTAVNRARDIVKQLLTVSKQSKIEFVNLDLITVIHEVVNMCRELFPRYIKITEFYDSKELIIKGDYNQLYQVVLNLLINARDAIENEKNRLNDFKIDLENQIDGKETKGTMEQAEQENRENLDENLQVKKKTERIHRTYEGNITINLKQISNDHITNKFYSNIKSDYIVELRIADNGCGIENDRMKSIFEAFYTTKKSKGTGLGLATANQIIEDHKGSIMVYSDIHIGTTFRIAFPLIQEEKQVLEEENKIFFGSGTVMIVDDEKHILEVLQEMLETLGYTVYAFDNGRSSVEFFKNSCDKIDIAILDFNMPGYSGINTFSYLRDIKNDIPVIFSSGYMDVNEISQHHYDQAQVDFIHKPYNLIELSNVIYQVLNKRTLNQMEEE